MIEVHNVTKKYGSRAAVENLSFSVKKGEVVGFLGPNGAGKTTTMKIITGYMVPTAGEVKIADEDIFENPIKIKQKIGYLPEVPPIYSDMYVDKYLYYVAGLKKCPKDTIKSQVDSVVEKVGLQPVRCRLIHNISKGFKQRTGLAQALIGDPEILILDEPTVGLDPNQVLEMRNLISQLRGQHTIILSTHILSEVQATCDRIIIIKEGKMVTQESLSSLREKQAQSRRRISVRVKNVSEDLIQELKQLKGIEDVTSSPNSVLTLSADTGVGSDLNERVAKVVINKGAGLVELSESFSLEDVFLKLTKDEKAEERNYTDPV
ncbi:MAG: ATP-binding cassette domain-containing protein [Bdellovibrionales bacterium]|nr:ATP-binding cassette domain-containing protein [Bdellovibrionales bacterium]